MSLTHDDEAYLEKGGFGWIGALTLICTKDSAHMTSLEVEAWTPTAITARIPGVAPCTDEMPEWIIRIQPGVTAREGDATGNLRGKIAGAISKVAGHEIDVSPVFIVGQDGSGYPPVRH